MSQLPDTPKRFIAGAKCPQCNAIDKLVMYRLQGIQYRSCVACDFVEPMHFEASFQELDTRVNRSPQEREEAVSVIRLPE
jgi:hypothetical protein